MKKAKMRIGMCQRSCLQVLWLKQRGLRCTDVRRMVNTHSMCNFSYKSVHIALRRLQDNNLVEQKKTILGKLWTLSSDGLMYVAKNGLIPP